MYNDSGSNYAAFFFGQESEAVEMQKKALKKVIENYDISRVVNQHIQLFNELSKS